MYKAPLQLFYKSDSATTSVFENAKEFHNLLNISPTLQL